MAGAPKQIYTFQFAGAIYGVKLPRGYYTSIDTKLGLTAASESAVKGKVVFSVGEAVKRGLLVQLGIMYKKGVRLQRAKIVCALNSVQSALQELPDDTYRSYEIRSAFFTRQRRLG